MKDNTEKNIKVCLLTLGAYPVPATEGGAVETLVEIMAENYQSGDFECSLDIISKYFKSAEKQTYKYEKVNFRFIKYSSVALKLYKQIKRVVRKIFGFTPVRLAPYFSKALKLIRKEKYDIVIVENGMYFVEPLKKYCNSSVIFHLHNDFSNFEGQNPEVLVRNADMIITVSDYVSNKVKKSVECDYPVVTVKNVIDTAHFSEDLHKRQEAKNIRETYGFSKDDVVCLFVGRLIPEKGIHLLLDAIEKIDDSGIKLLVVGGTAFRDSRRTEFEEKLYSKAKKLGSRVAFTGYVDYKDIPSYYHACDIVVFPSQWEEAAGLVVLEAQSAGKPVIIAQSGGMPEYVCEKSAIIVEKGCDFTDNLVKAINTLSSSCDLRKKMGNSGISFSEKYDKEGYFNEIIKAIEKTLFRNKG